MKPYNYINAILVGLSISISACKAEEDPFADYPPGGEDPEPLVINEDYLNDTDLTIEERLQQKFTLTTAETTTLVGIINSWKDTLSTAQAASGTDQLGSSYVTQAVTLYNSLPRETTPIVGLSRDIPDSIAPYFDNEDAYVAAYEKGLVAAKVNDYMKLLIVLGELDKDQLLNFALLASPKSVPAKIDCALYGVLIELVRENPFNEAALGVKNVTNWHQWNGLHNPVYRHLGLIFAPSVISDKAQRITFLEPYLQETDDLLVGQLIISYAAVGNQTAKTKLQEIATAAGTRGQLELQQKATEAAAAIE